MKNEVHRSVLSQELIQGLDIKAGQTVIDCTAGYGGHLSLCLEKTGPSGLVIGIDQDKNAIDFLKNRFKEEIKSERLLIYHDRFSSIGSVIQSSTHSGTVDRIYADIGVSSPQLDQPERGFSFSKDGPLDMRMDQNKKTSSAKEVIEDLSEKELSEVIKKYSDEPKSSYLAKKIKARIAEQPFNSTVELADYIKDVYPRSYLSKKHPATKVFQALRIYVNRELEELECLVNNGPAHLNVRGRFAIITFHSLEDRLVKQSFKILATKKKQFPRDLPIIEEDLEEDIRADFKVVRPFPILPSESEVTNNPRSRSAKLRIIEKLH